jgi:outer membrane protein OmpA-like peptidoglycan-associated protein
MLLRVLGIAALTATFTASAAPQYVNAPALTDVVASTAVGDVGGGTVEVPIITWGGDMATLLANGNQLRTKAGSLFASEGLDLNLHREDVFAKQLQAYLSGRSPYLRGTLGMINMAAEAASKDPRTRPVVIYQMTWSSGGDSLVVKPGIGAAKDLKGKTIALQAYGPHVDYLTKVLADAGLSTDDVKLKWLPDLTGTANTPMGALQQRDVDAAFVITPDAMVLTSGGAVGSGAEDSVKGARILLSTKTANRIIADVYAVRADYLQKNRKQVEGFVHGLLLGEEKLREVVRAKASKPAEFKAAMTASATALLDSAEAAGDAEGLYGDAEFVGHHGNTDFFANPNYPRSLAALNGEIQSAFASIGLMRGKVALADAAWDWARLRQGLADTGAQTAQRFDEAQVASVVSRKQQQGTLKEGELFSFEIFFQPNQNTFSGDLYQADFDKVIDLASTYGGALITIEGHSDPMGYLSDKKAGKPEVVLGRVKQAAKNLSLSRSVAVRDSVIAYARAKKGISLDESQFAVVGHGISLPRNGMCGADPCAPKNEREWRDNMRVEFRIIQVEAEASVFKPL